MYAWSLRWVSFAVFFAVILGLDALVHWYLWARLVRDPAWSPEVRMAGAVFFVLLAVLLPLGMIVSRTVERGLAKPIATAAFVWMGTAFILCSVVLLVEVLRVLLVGVMVAYAKLGQGGEAPELARREVLARGAALGAGVVGAVTSGLALRSGLGEVEVREVEVKLARLPPALSGLTVVQLSDVHVGPLIGERFMRELVARVNGLKPDAVVITGDLVDGGVHELAAHVGPLAELRARWGTYFVTGNHEYYSGVDGWLAELARHRVRTLRNEHLRLGDAASIDLAGIDDAMSGRFGGGHGPDLARALRGRDPERGLVLLAHQPKGIEDAARAGVELQLSGHTHGGQIWPFGHVVSRVQPYLAGLYQHDASTQIYVSRGTGFWGPPMRLGAPAEITKLVLV